MKQNQFIILAMNTGNEEGEANRLRALNIDFKCLEGVYNGMSESNWLCIINSKSDYIKLRDLAIEFNQECILYSNEDRDSWLINTKYSIGEMRYIGKMQCVSKLEAINHSGYTYDAKYGRYYITKGL